MQIKQRLALFAAGLVGVAGLGTGVARAQPAGAAVPAATAASATHHSVLPHAMEPEVVEELRQAGLPPGGYADARGTKVGQERGEGT
jgi:hypothetical protein